MAILSSDQVDAIYQAARPLRPSDQAAFFQDVSTALTALGDEVGDGVIFRIVKTVQRKYFDPPDLKEAHTVPFWKPGRNLR